MSSPLPLKNTWQVKNATNIAARILDENTFVQIDEMGHGEYAITTMKDGAQTTQQWTIEYTSHDGLLISGSVDDLYGFVIAVGGHQGLPGILGIVYGQATVDFNWDTMTSDPPGTWEADETGT